MSTGNSACRAGRKWFVCAVLCVAMLPVARLSAVELLVSITNTNEVRRYDGNTGAPMPAYDAGLPAGTFIGSSVPGGNGGLATPYGLLLGVDGNVYVASWGNNTIKMYDGTTGRYIRDFVTAGSGGLFQPDSLAWGPDGNLYVSSYGSGTILRYQGPNGASPGSFMGVFVSAGSGGMTSPQGILFGPPDSTDGNLYVASSIKYRIYRYDKNTGAFLNVFADGGTVFPFTNMIFEQVYHDETQLQYTLADYHHPVDEYNKLWTGNMLASSSISKPLQVYGPNGEWWTDFRDCTFAAKGMAWGPYRAASGDSAKRGSLYVANYGVNTVKYVGPNEMDCGALITSLLKPTYLMFKCGRNPGTLIRHVFGNNGRQGNTAHTVILQGDNLEALMPAHGGSVTLRKMRNEGNGTTNDGTATLAGSNYRMGGDTGKDLFVDFNLTGAEAGRYGVFPSDPCGFAMPFPDAVLVYLPTLTNGSFEDGWKVDSRENNDICHNPGQWDSQGGGNKSRPMHWDPKHFGWQDQFDLHRDGNVWYPCTPCEGVGSCMVVGLTGRHYASIQNNFSNGDLNGMFQTIAAPYVPEGSQTSIKPYSIYIDAHVASFVQASFGRIVLYDGDDLAGTVIAETIIPNTQGMDPNALIRSPEFKATVPAGYTYQSSPPLLTIEFLSQSVPGDQSDDGTMALKGFHLDNVRNYYACDRASWADADEDGDVDQADFGEFQKCYTGTVKGDLAGMRVLRS